MASWIWPDWVMVVLGAAGLVWGLAAFVGSRRGIRSSSDRWSAWALLLASVALLVVGLLRWTGVWSAL